MTKSLAGDIEEALRSNTAALSTFEGLPPSHKREYLNWITGGWASGPASDRSDRARVSEAKRDDTRKRRIAGMIDKLNKADNGQA
jgi:uncharacterized protein YdeI (YjbR/CyaY-like superfamily)